MRASAENLLAAKAFGVDVWRLRLISWVLGGVMCGAAGILYAYFMGTINARAFHFELVMTTLAMLILGGMRTVSGAVFGTVLLSILLEAIRSLESGVEIGGIALPQMLGLSGLAMGAVIVLGMTFRPQRHFRAPGTGRTGAALAAPETQTGRHFHERAAERRRGPT